MMCLILLVNTSPRSFVSRFFTISDTANRPTATIVKPMPSVSSGSPKEKRAIPEFTSVPTMPTSNPRTTMASAFTMSPLERHAAATKAISIREKYSGAPNLSAISAIGGPNSAISSVPTQPATNEATAAIASAGPARPWRAIW